MPMKDHTPWIMGNYASKSKSKLDAGVSTLCPKKLPKPLHPQGSNEANTPNPAFVRPSFGHLRDLSPSKALGCAAAGLLGLSFGPVSAVATSAGTLFVRRHSVSLRPAYCEELDKHLQDAWMGSVGLISQFLRVILRQNQTICVCVLLLSNDSEQNPFGS